MAPRPAALATLFRARPSGPTLVPGSHALVAGHGPLPTSTSLAASVAASARPAAAILYRGLRTDRTFATSSHTSQRHGAAVQPTLTPGPAAAADGAAPAPVDAPPLSPPPETAAAAADPPPGLSDPDPPPAAAPSTDKAGAPSAVLAVDPPTTAPSSPSSRPDPDTLAQPVFTFTPPPHVHHFDSYSLVQRLSQADYTLLQAETSMKAIRNILAHNLAIAQNNLVYRRDIENETYLFRAACSELNAEVRNNRRLAAETMRQSRINLQKEIDILAHNLNQQILTLADNVRGMFDDRRMAVREEQKANESAIQQIGYMTSIMLSSGAKSEIEALRWILMRRAVLGILIMVVITLGTLRYANHLAHEHDRDLSLRASQEEARRRPIGSLDQAGPDPVTVLPAI